MTLRRPSTADADLVRKAVREELRVHVRLADQGHALDEDARNRLAQKLPDLRAFGANRYHAVRAILDWDHHLPSQYALLRIHACWDRGSTNQLDDELADRTAEIDQDNLYPEFDLPDYGDLVANESYVAILKPGGTDLEDFQFLSPWRKQVRTEVADVAIRAVRAHDGYERATARRRTAGLGGPVVVGWAPPCLAHCDRWAVEIWLLTEFDGHSGKARVFMVDIDDGEVTREFDTDVQLA